MQYLLLMMAGLLWLLQARPAQAAFEEELILPNGLKVIMAPQPSNPLLTARLMIKTGSGGEVDRADFGLAHLMEHMAFKSTAGGRSEGQIAWEVESAGGSIGAYTWLDETVYYLTLPADSAEMAFDLLADMVFNPAYDPDEFSREKEVVVEEIKKYADLPGDVLAENLYSLLFAGQAYGHPITGYEDTVRQADEAGVREFFLKNYRPDNAVLILSGGLAPDEIKPLLYKYFGALKTPPSASRPSGGAAAPLNSEQPLMKTALSPKTDLALVELAFRSFPGRDPDSVPAELLAAILSLTQASRLDERVKSGQALATDISCQSTAFREAGLFSIYLETEADKVAEAVEAVLAELTGLVERPPDSDELARVRAMSAAYFLAQQESSEGLGRVLGEFENFQGDWRLKDARLSQWERVGADDLLRVARQMFRPDNIAVSLVLPAREAERAVVLEKEIPALLSVLDLKSGPETEAFSENSFTEFPTWPEGPRLAVSPDKSLPFITVKAGVMGGLLAEGKSREGLSSLAAEIWPLAAGTRLRPDFLRAAERLGASFSATSGRNTFFLTARFPSRNKEEALDLMSAVLTAPLFTEADLEEARQDQLAALRQQAEDPAAVAALISRRALFGEHPYALNPLGRRDSLASFTPETLRSFYHSIFRPERLVIAVAGDVEARWLEEGLKKRLGGWANSGPPLEIGPTPRVEPPRSTAIIREVMDRSQTHLRLTFPAPGLGRPDQAALEVLSDYLGGGMGGPLFMELREKRSLAYDLYSHYLPGLDGGEFIFYIATDPAKSGEALAGLQAIISDCRERLLEPDEIEGARQLTLGKRKRSEETAADRAEAALLHLLYGLGLDFEARHQAAVASVSAEEVRKAAENYLVMDQAVVVAVGPEESLKLIP